MVLARGSSKGSDWWILMEISIWAWLLTEVQERDLAWVLARIQERWKLWQLDYQIVSCEFPLGNGLGMGLSKASFWWKFRILNGVMEANQSF